MGSSHFVINKGSLLNVLSNRINRCFDYCSFDWHWVSVYFLLFMYGVQAHYVHVVFCMISHGIIGVKGKISHQLSLSHRRSLNICRLLYYENLFPSSYDMSISSLLLLSSFTCSTTTKLWWSPSQAFYYKPRTQRELKERNASIMKWRE